MELPIIKTEITYMEMLAPSAQPAKPMVEYSVSHVAKPDYDFYINLYRAVGRDYIWNYRPSQTRQEVTDLIQSDANQLYVLQKDGVAVGMAELDVTNPQDVEIIHFGLLPELTGKGIGGAFLQHIITMLWDSGVNRVWLSTCGLDHAKAIPFYQNAGFKVFKTKEGEFKDYRYTDFYDMTDAPQIPQGVAYFNCQAGSAR